VQSVARWLHHNVVFLQHPMTEHPLRGYRIDPPLILLPRLELLTALEHELSQAQLNGAAVNQTSLGKCLIGFRWLCPKAYRRWRKLGLKWIGSALELIAGSVDCGFYSPGTKFKRRKPD
jgi:hypothetical protein